MKVAVILPRKLGSSLSVELTASGVDFKLDILALIPLVFNPAGVTVESFAVSSSKTVSLNLSLDKMPQVYFK